MGHAIGSPGEIGGQTGGPPSLPTATCDAVRFASRPHFDHVRRIVQLQPHILTKRSPGRFGVEHVGGNIRIVVARGLHPVAAGQAVSTRAAAPSCSSAIEISRIRYF